MRLGYTLESFYNVAREEENAKGENASCGESLTVTFSQMQKFDNKVY